MTIHELVTNLMENDQEGIERMSVDRAAEILEWLRDDDEDGNIPDDITAEDIAAEWNAVKGLNGKRFDVCSINLNEGEGRQIIYWDTEDGRLHTDYDGSEAYGVELNSLQEAQDTAAALWSTIGWDIEWCENG